jgi:hypothetical protein
VGDLRRSVAEEAFGGVVVAGGESRSTITLGRGAGLANTDESRSRIDTWEAGRTGDSSLPSLTVSLRGGRTFRSEELVSREKALLCGEDGGSVPLATITAAAIHGEVDVISTSLL